jgi:hypothetical protein
VLRGVLNTGTERLVFVYTAFVGAFAKLRKVTVGSVMSVRPSAWNNAAPTGRIFMKFDIGTFFENLSRNSKFH